MIRVSGQRNSQEVVVRGFSPFRRLVHVAQSDRCGLDRARRVGLLSTQNPRHQPHNHEQRNQRSEDGSHSDECHRKSTDRRCVHSSHSTAPVAIGKCRGRAAASIRRPFVYQKRRLQCKIHDSATRSDRAGDGSVLNGTQVRANAQPGQLSGYFGENSWASQRSASIAAIQPVPAAVTACR